MRVHLLIMMIFRVVSSPDARCGAYRATGTELDWMRRGAQGLCEERPANFQTGAFSG